MPDSEFLPGVTFAEPARARANLDRLEARLSHRLFLLLPTLLAQVPDPDASLNYLERFAREARGLVLAGLERHPALLHYLLVLFSYSCFLSETLLQQPELILWLGREKQLEGLKSKEELLEEYARFQTTALDVEPALALARFKRRQYLRITLKDILGIAPLVETTLELSTLADVLLEKALAMADHELQRRHGAPQTTDARGRLVPARFAVVSLGKLGGNELNYSSDIDLLFLFAGEGETGAPEPSRRLTNTQYFIGLAQRFLQLIAGVTREGPVFRVDLRLRPGGGEGDLAISLPAALDYYERRAREWELQMLLKARHSAGDAALVREFLTGVEPNLYRGSMHFAAVDAVLKAREQFDRKLDVAGDERLNVKLAPGGLRDIEFLVQCLQRLHGRDDPWVRAGGTLVGLQKLYEKGYLSPRDHQQLAAAYQSLRRVEHRLQLEQGQQTHMLPADTAALELVVRRCGVSARAGRPAAAEFLRQLNQHLRHVRDVHELSLPRGSERRAAPENFALRAPSAQELAGERPAAALAVRLRALGSPLADALEGWPLDERAQKALQKFLAAAMSSSAVFEAVNRAAAALPAALAILRASEPFAAMLMHQPERLQELAGLSELPLADSRQLGLELPAGETPLPATLRAVAEPHAPLAEQMANLRRYYADSLFRWGAVQLCRSRPVEAGLRDYTRLADDMLRAGLDIAPQHAAGAAPMVVLALGRLGTREMDLGSDADVVFLAAEPSDSARARQAAEKLLHVISAYTRDGTLFPLDLRLRPRGGEGELVLTAEAALDYFARSAEIWEAVTYLKARPVAGELVLGEAWCRRLRDALRERFSEWEPVRAGLASMRRRLEEESAGALAESDNFKTGPGGLYDLDFILAAWALRAGAQPLGGLSWAEQIEALRDEAGLPDAEVHELKLAAEFFRQLDHAIRLVTGRSAARLPAGPRLELVAELVGRWREERLSGALLAGLLEDERRRLRALFEQVFS